MDSDESTSCSSSSDSEEEEIHCLMADDNDEIKSSNEFLDKIFCFINTLHEVQKSFNDKTGLGFSSSERSSSDTCTQSDLVNDKLKKMSFVKSSVIHDTLESVKYDDQNASNLNQKGNQGIGYTQTENSKPSWLKNRLDKDRVKSDRSRLI
ncbi:hypothetical protein F511_22767 [Dorcoceras hygrometricum]|uniref:Uncharacterized protein n=1 Tax=Dorcoceras hygrometricum TaxID=472368 RepID=A0A2Z7D8E2_9LAMI|nr:hypothetical protein F511_22767 [Dorcoceras hygrometricum]